MSWRRFLVLVRGLSVNSTLVNSRVAAKRRGEDEGTLVEGQQAQRAFVSLFGHLKKRPRASRGAARATVGAFGEPAEKTPTRQN